MKKLITITALTLLIIMVIPGCQAQPESSTSPSPSNLPVTPVPGPPNASPSPLTLNPDLWNLDYATIKYDSRGNELWEARYSGPDKGDNMAEALAVDDEGNVYIAGQSQGKNGDWDYATVKYNSNGRQLWASRYDGLANSIDTATSLAVDSEVNVYVTGGSGGTAGIPITIQSPWPDVPIYTDVTQLIKTRTGGEIAFGFETGTRLGLGWDEAHDENMISLVDQELVMNQTGISGTTWFLFKALKQGETRITFIYGHGGGGPAADTKEFHIEVEK